MMPSTLVVGASLAGTEVARALRREGYAGAIIVAGAETHAPYDRPELSKGFLTGAIGLEDVMLEELDPSTRVVLGAEAASLDVQTRTVTFVDGSTLTADHVVVATGSSPRRLPNVDPTATNVHVLRGIDDAVRLRAALAHARHLVIVGGGFIGSEVASSARSLGCEVTLIEAQSLPLEAQLGSVCATWLADQHRDRGVTLETNALVAGIETEERHPVVALEDGRRIAADVVLVALGNQPNTAWLRTSGLDLSDGVACDHLGATEASGVFAVGDCAGWADDGVLRRREHWTAALSQAGTVARHIVHGVDRCEPAGSLDYIWSDQHGSRVQIAGQVGSTFESLSSDDMPPGTLACVYVDKSSVIRGVACINQPREFGRWRRRIGQRHPDR